MNGGVVLKPQVSGPEGFTATERWRLPEGTRLEGLSTGFAGAVNEGSASAAFDPEVAVAGKTGTCSALGWFASYAPADRPELVVVVFLRHGSGHGASAVAGRIFRQLFGSGAVADRRRDALDRGPLQGHLEARGLARRDVDLGLRRAEAGPHHFDPVPPGREPQRLRPRGRFRGTLRRRRPRRPPAAR